MTLYIDSQPDYYEKQFSFNSYEEILTNIINTDNQTLCVTDRGIEIIGIISLIFEKIKGFLGFGDNTDPVAINAEILKFLYHGEISGKFLNQNIAERLYSVNDKFMDQTIATAFVYLREHRNDPDSSVKKNESEVKKSKSDEINNEVDIKDRDAGVKNRDVIRKKLQDHLVTYHEQHQSQLIPSLWQRVFTAETVVFAANEKFEFGDTYFKLAEGLVGVYGNIGYHNNWAKRAQILQYIETAVKLDNASKTFQSKLREHFIRWTSHLNTENPFRDFGKIDAIYSTLADRDIATNENFASVKRFLTSGLTRFFRHESPISEDNKKLYRYSPLLPKLISYFTKLGDDHYAKNEPEVAELMYYNAYEYLYENHSAATELKAKALRCVYQCGEEIQKKEEPIQAIKYYERMEKKYGKDNELNNRLIALYKIGFKLAVDKNLVKEIQTYADALNERAPGWEIDSSTKV